MFCPSCGSEQRGQYCRSCGKDLRGAETTRSEIVRVVADKIREVKSAKDLSTVVDDVLPEIAEFLETPEEKRLRRIRAGMITAAIGLGVGLTFCGLGVVIKETALLFVGCFGLIAFLLGLGIVLNGWLFTIPQKRRIDQASEPSMQPAKESPLNFEPEAAAQERLRASSVTEHTTQQLPDSQLRAREAKLD